MLVPQLLLETLEKLRDKDLETLKWYLSMKILDGCNPIGQAHLEKASRMQTVSKMIDSYGEESAVKVTVEILRKMNLNGPAEDLKRRYAAGKSATPASSSSSSSSSAVARPAAPAAPAAPAGMVAQRRYVFTKETKLIPVGPFTPIHLDTSSESDSEPEFLL